MLALLVVLSMATVAFADEEVTAEEKPWDGKYAPTTLTTFNQIEKTYTSENNVVVYETLSFTSTAKTTNPDGGKANLSVANLTVNSLIPSNLTVTIPALSKAGIYEWTIKETPGTTAGVTYSTEEVHVIVLVEYDNKEHKLVIANTTSYILGETQDGENGEKEVVKKDTFTNTFESGSFTVAKDVVGNMANEMDLFEITVTLTSSKPIGTTIIAAGETVTSDLWTPVKDENEKITGYTYTSVKEYADLNGKDVKTFSNIPVGVTVTVTEKDDETRNDGYQYKSTKIGSNNFTSLTVVKGNNGNIVVTNEKTASVNTGIALDSMPYFVLLSVACVGMFLLLTKKRANREF